MLDGGETIRLKVVIDLGKIKENFDRVKAGGGKVMLMLKADAYGHGALEVARAIRTADMFGVATLDEAEALREGGIKGDILALACAPSELLKAAELNIVVGLYCRAQIDAVLRLTECGSLDPADLRVHIKLDTGMHRLGFCEEELDDVLSALKKAGVRAEGVYSHLRNLNHAQAEAFDRMSAKAAKFFPNAIRHLAASAGCKKRSLAYDMTRVGYAAYEGAMTVTSRAIDLRRVRGGECVGYGRVRVRESTNIVTVFGGYADGMDREGKAFVLIRGKECPVVGRACMDMFMADAGDMYVSVGEEVVLLSPEIAQKLAKQRGTIPYALMTCWRGRTERIYI